MRTPAIVQKSIINLETITKMTTPINFGSEKTQHQLILEMHTLILEMHPLILKIQKLILKMQTLILKMQTLMSENENINFWK